MVLKTLVLHYCLISDPSICSSVQSPHFQLKTTRRPHNGRLSCKCLVTVDDRILTLLVLEGSSGPPNFVSGCLQTPTDESGKFSSTNWADFRSAMTVEPGGRLKSIRQQCSSIHIKRVQSTKERHGDATREGARLKTRKRRGRWSKETQEDVEAEEVEVNDEKLHDPTFD